MAKHRTRVGLHARNDVHFPEYDYELVSRARIETLKMMSFTDVSVYDRLRRENPGIEFIVRLYDDRIGTGRYPSARLFVDKMVPVINRLKLYAVKFEIHNEPNHNERIEGWGSLASDARAFCAWYETALIALKEACPWAEFGFPGLAPNHPHNDIEWLTICQDVINASDWLGCHCYWQYGNMLSQEWGLRFQLYHEMFPTLPIEITEFADSTPPAERSRETIATEYVQYYRELNKSPYVNSASSFIASSPDPSWVAFVWMKEGGEMLPVVHAVGNMERTGEEVPEPQPEPQPAPGPGERTFPETGKTVRGDFLTFFNTYGLDICGYPITEQFQENGLPSQYFQRLAMEQVSSGQVRLKLVGTEALASRQTIANLEQQIEELRQLPPGSGPAKPDVEDISDQLPTHPSKVYPTRSLSEIDQIVIHHTATSPTITPERLAKYQVNRQDRAGIIYHYLIDPDGTCYQTNSLETVSDHAFDRNQASVGVVFPGDFTSEIPTPEQITAGGQLCAWLLASLQLPIDSIVGLREFVTTASPGAQWMSGQKWKDLLLTQVQTALDKARQEESEQIAALLKQIQDLQAQIEVLQSEIEKLKEQVPEPSPTPAPSPMPGPGQVAKPSIQDLVDSLRKHETKEFDTRTLDDITTLVVHHSATVPTLTPQRIAEYHVTKLDWPGIGYHFVVSAEGGLYQTNRLETVSYHATKANPFGVGICFLGNFTHEVPPDAQLQAGAHLIAWLLQELDIKDENVRGHKVFTATACPGNQWLTGKKWKEMLYGQVDKVQKETAQPRPTPGSGKALYQYMLFWHHGDQWAMQDWLNAQNYIGAFQPTVGFSATDAAQAEYVTIVGGPLGVSLQVETWLRAQGCKIDRIAGQDEAETKRMFDELVDQGKRFQGFNG